MSRYTEVLFPDFVRDPSSITVPIGICSFPQTETQRGLRFQLCFKYPIFPVNLFGQEKAFSENVHAPYENKSIFRGSESDNTGLSKRTPSPGGN